MTLNNLIRALKMMKELYGDTQVGVTIENGDGITDLLVVKSVGCIPDKAQLNQIGISIYCVKNTN